MCPFVVAAAFPVSLLWKPFVSLLEVVEPFVCGEECGDELLPLVDVCCLCSFDRILGGGRVEGGVCAALCRFRLEPAALLEVGVEADGLGEEERRRRLRGRSSWFCVRVCGLSWVVLGWRFA